MSTTKKERMNTSTYSGDNINNMDEMIMNIGQGDEIQICITIIPGEWMTDRPTTDLVCRNHFDRTQKSCNKTINIRRYNLRKNVLMLMLMLMFQTQTMSRDNALKAT